MCLAASYANFLPCACLLALVLPHLAVVLATREGAFPNYYERDLATYSSSPAQAAGLKCRDQHADCKGWADKGECRRNAAFMAQSCRVACKLCSPVLPNPADFKTRMLALVTSYGSIRIQLLLDTAPKTSLLIMDLAAQDSSSKASCKFYRNEAVSTAGSTGPPYGLLQGSMTGLLQVPPSEVSQTHLPLRGAVAMISGTDFYISLMDHSDWGSVHTVWGYVLEQDMATVDTIVQQAPYRNYTHPVYGTVMRMMRDGLPFEPVLQPIEGTLLDMAEL